MKINIALAGNPNSGKTTMFNALTGSSQYVGNWPGVTVEKKEGRLKGHKNVLVMDLPGIYSLSPYTLEEIITRDYLLNEHPDVIINLVDATNIERNLYLTTQLLEVGIPVIIALNMMDVVKRNKDEIDILKLKDALGCEIVETSSLKGTGLKEVAQKAIEAAGRKTPPKVLRMFSAKTEEALSKISGEIEDKVETDRLRWYCVKLFEQDEKVVEHFSINEKISSAITECEKEAEDDSESIITNERYEYIANITKKYVKKKRTGLTPSDKIDRVLTNRWLALPIFVAIMWLVYYVSIQTVGDWTIGWVEELFGFLSYGVERALLSVGAADWLISLTLDGIIGGVGAVLGFVPQMMILFCFLSILENCGYMARVAFIMDRIFRKFGLSGKSFIPLLISAGCGVPGIMASRTIENERDRKMTIMITTFVPCGAKLPIIALISGALFPASSWVAPSIYFLGISMVILSGIILKKTRLFQGKPAPFVMELPSYHFPRPKGVLIHMWERGKAFIIKAGTVIFVACGIIWFLQSFSWSMEMVYTSESMLASIGRFIAPVFAPLGFGEWEAAVATLTGFVAKENVVGTFGVLFAMEELAEDGMEIWGSFATMFTLVSGYSFLVFNMLCAPCFAAIGAIKREMGGWKWTWIAIGYQTALAYVVSYIVFHLGSVLFLGKSFQTGAAVAVLAVLAIIWLLLKKPKDTNLTKQRVQTPKEVTI